jgi:replication factor A3
MAESLSTPRINFSYLDHFTGRTVRLTGKVVQLRGEEATIDAGGHITAHLSRDSHLTVGNAVEIIGKVNQDLSVKVLQSTDMGSNLGRSSLALRPETGR